MSLSACRLRTSISIIDLYTRSRGPPDSDDFSPVPTHCPALFPSPSSFAVALPHFLLALRLSFLMSFSFSSLPSFIALVDQADFHRSALIQQFACDLTSSSNSWVDMRHSSYLSIRASDKVSSRLKMGMCLVSLQGLLNQSMPFIHIALTSLMILGGVSAKGLHVLHCKGTFYENAVKEVVQIVPLPQFSTFFFKALARLSNPQALIYF